jgi:hypothetical protein
VLCFIACYAIISSRHTTAGLLAAVDGHTLFRRAPKSIVAAALSLVPTLCSRRPLPRPVVVHSPEVRPVRRRHRGHRARRLSRQQRGHVVRPQFGRWMARTLEIRHYISIRFLPRDGNPSLIWRTARFACTPSVLSRGPSPGTLSCSGVLSLRPRDLYRSGSDI